MFQMLGLIAEFERSMVRDRVVSGMARARPTGTKSGRAIGRPAATKAAQNAIRALLGAGQSERAIVQQLGVGVSKGAVGHVRAAMAAGRALARRASKHASRGLLHSMTSVARASNSSGMAIPRGRAVFRLMASSNFVGCATGNTAGLVPRRIRPA
jgi:hypothetical protein